MNKFVWVLLLILFFFLVMPKCDSLPDDLVKKAESVPAAIKNVDKNVEKRKSDLDSFRKTSDYRKLKIYDERESWSKHFEDASRSVSVASEINKSQIVPVLDKDESKDAGKLKVLLSRLEIHLKDAEKFAKKPGKESVSFRMF